MIDHLANRTTARERVTYHVAKSYMLKESPVPYGSLTLPERDTFQQQRALPPAEEMVLVAWYNNDAQLELARDDAGFVYMRLGRRRGALHVDLSLATVRHVLMRTFDNTVAPGLLWLRKSGFKILTRSQLRVELNQHAKGKGVAAWQARAEKDDEETIYALFQTSADHAWDEQGWNGKKLMDLIEKFESEVTNRTIKNVGRDSPDARVLSLRDVLKTLT